MIRLLASRHSARWLAAIAVVSAAPLVAQQRDSVTAADYAHAERFLGQHTTPLVVGANVRPVFLHDGRFWFRNTTPAGWEYVLIDPVRRTRAAAFNQPKVAAALSAASGSQYDAAHLPITQFDLTPDGKSILFVAGQRRWSCDVEGTRCSDLGTAERGNGRRGVPNTDVPSPDGKRTAFIRDYNLWVRDVASGAETQLTTDGVKDFGYATDNAGWVHSDRPIVLWSPDSKRIATFQQDERGVGKMYLVRTEVGHPTLMAWNYPLPGDSVITTIQRVVIDVDGKRVVRLQMPADQHRSTDCDHIACHGGDFADVQWSADAAHLYFVSTSRDHKSEVLREADPNTGAVRDILTETVPTQYESGFNHENWQVLPASHEVIWFSERDNWGHLYLYDLTTGKLKNRITSGAWPVLQLLRTDAKTRTVYFTGAGRDATDPYFRQLYRASMNGSSIQLLTPEDDDHDVTLSPDGRFFVDSYSRPDTPPITVLRDNAGRLLMSLEKSDISRLVATGWKPPVRISVKARDGKTDLYGLMYLPTRLDSTRKYPIVNHIYPGPQTGSVGSRSFIPSRGDAQALAELGFVVVELDAMGTPMRSKSFHDAYYGNMGDNGLPDQIAGMRQLAARYPFIDIDRAGIYGHSGGGFATADAMFRYPDFFKVGISESGNHDNREYEDDWGERYQGLLTRGPDGTTNYDDQANQNIARNLKGHLLLAHGTMDDNVPPYNTLLVVDALIRANKDFDLLLLPNQQHGYSDESNYMMRRRWDYFVKWLAGKQPPVDYRIGGGSTRAGG